MGSAFPSTILLLHSVKSFSPVPSLFSQIFIQFIIHLIYSLPLFQWFPNSLIVFQNTRHLFFPSDQTISFYSLVSSLQLVLLFHFLGSTHFVSYPILVTPYPLFYLNIFISGTSIFRSKALLALSPHSWQGTLVCPMDPVWAESHSRYLCLIPCVTYIADMIIMAINKLI